MRTYIVACLVAGAFAFTPSVPKGSRSHCQRTSTAAITQSSVSCRSVVKLFAEDSQQSVESASASETTAVVSTEVQPAQPTSTIPATSSTKSDEEPDKKYPLDIPSPLLLGTSMVLAISGTGTLVVHARQFMSRQLASTVFCLYAHAPRRSSDTLNCLSLCLRLLV